MEVDERALLTGVTTLLILMVVMGIADFYSWLTLTLLSYLSSALVIVPIAYGIVKREFDKNTCYMIEVGVIILIAYMMLSGKEPYDILIGLLQTIVVITLLSTMVGVIKKYL